MATKTSEDINFSSPAKLPIDFSSCTTLARLCGEARGMLQQIEPAGEDIIAIFSCHDKPLLVALPGEIQPQLLPLVGKKAGIMRYRDRYIVRCLS